MALFAACTNDDFISNEQGIQSGDAAMRPTVDVTLNVLGDGADTRLAFGSEGYQWQANDTIGALLMDEVLGTDRPHQEDWKDLVWTEKYGLVDFINTDYPFVRQSDGTWQTNAKMLEGNYFFSFPFASYSGNREAIHSLGEQVQDGTTDEALAEAYAKNQFFVGYARIHAGTEGGDVMSANLEMTPMLGAVGLTIKNVGTDEFKVEKIVLQSDAFSTLIKIDPTMANYDGENGKSDYNLEARKLTSQTNHKWNALPSGDKAGFFNYANYEEMQRSGDTWTYLPEFSERYGDGALVNNTKKADNYNRQEALRAVVNPITEGDGADNRAELTVLNAPVQKTQESARFLIMTNIYENGSTEDINAYIYTNRGVAGPVKINNPKGEIETDGVTVITDNPIKEIAPGVSNSVTLEIDDNSIKDPDEMPVYNESDLLQLIAWNQDKERVYEATLKNDVVLDKEMTDLLTDKNVVSRLHIFTNGKKLYIDKDAAADILDYVYVDGGDGTIDGTATIIVGNALTLGSKSLVNGEHKPGKIYTGAITLKNQLEIAEGASVTVASDIKYRLNGDNAKQELVIAKNEGTVTINGAVDRLTIAENKAEVEINKNVTFAGNSTNKEKAVITIGEGAVVSCGTATNSYLTNAGKKTAEKEEYAVIYNNGTINNLVNAEYGKVIAGAASRTNANSNEGIIDISSNIEANWKVNGTTGVVSYAATKETSVSITQVIKSGITELVLDGGDVTALDYVRNVTTQAQASAAAVKTIKVTEDGGVLGEAYAVNGQQAHWRTQFPAVTTVETEGDVIFYDVDITAATKFDVKAGETTIKGLVDATSAIFTLGSYDDEKYVAYDATLNVPTRNDALYAKNVIKTGEEGAENVVAKVYNQGMVKLDPNVVTSGITWEGDGEDNRPSTALEDAMNAAIKVWINEASATYYENDPYALDKFASAMSVWNDGRSTEKEEAAKLAGELELAKGADADAWKTALNNAETKFKEVVEKLLSDNVEALKGVIIENGALVKAPSTQDNTLHKDQTEAYDILRAWLADNTNTKADSKVIAAAAYELEDTDLQTAVENADGVIPYLYIWDGCLLDKAVALWRDYKDLEVAGYSNIAANSYTEGIEKSNVQGYLLHWFQNVLNANSTGLPSLKQAQDDIKALGIDLKNVEKKLGTYVSSGTSNAWTKDQILECDKN